MNKNTGVRTTKKRVTIWQYVILLSVLVSSIVYALPNIYGSDPSLQISSNAINRGKSNSANLATFPGEIRQNILQLLKDQKITFKSASLDGAALLIRFHDVDTQFKAFDLVDAALPDSYTISYLLVSRSPQWLSAIGATPMKLGLDLQGGVHLVYQVDMDEAINKAEKRHVEDFRFLLQDAKIRYKYISRFNTGSHRGINITFNSADDQRTASALLARVAEKLETRSNNTANAFQLEIGFSPDKIKEIQRRTMEKNIATFRNRANELGISEPIIQKQGNDRIIVELPGIQDPEHIKDILSSTATLEFRLVQE